MSHINVTINARQYRMACEEGQEVRLLKLAESLETRIQSLRGKFGEIGDARLTVMAALTVCDELLDAGQRIRALEEDSSQRIRALEAELDTLRDVRVAAADRARATQTAVANALNSAADRIEKTTQVLNRTIGGGVAIG
jgi:cell division protein ZapA